MPANTRHSRELFFGAVHARRRRSSLLALGVCACVAASSASAFASGTDANTTIALGKFDEGRNAFEGGRFEEALLAFQQSNSLSASPNSRLYMARCYRALGKVASAYTTYRLAAREAQDRLTATGERRYGATRDAATSEGAELEPKVPRLTMVVPGGLPEGFTLKENGAEVAKEAWGVAVETDPGDLTLEATGPRLFPWKKSVTLAEGAQERIEIEAKRVPTATLALKLRALPAGLSITVDRVPIEVGTAEKAREVDVGAHEIVASAPGYVPFHWAEALTDAQQETVAVTLAVDLAAGSRASAGTPKWISLTVAGVALAALATASGIALHADAESNQQQALDLYARDPGVKSSIQSQATVADVLFVGAGVLGAGAGVLAFTTRWKSEVGHAIAFTPWLFANAGGVVGHGTF